MDKKIGIIDLGSNSVRLVIFEIKHNGAYRLVDDISDAIRLSENMVEGKYLNDFSMRKAVKTIKLFKKLCSDYGIPGKSIISVATEAVRKAHNRDQFLKLIHSATGLSFRVLSGEEEAAYVYKAVISTFNIDNGIIVDIGGGSTEIIKFTNKNIVNSVSFPIGAVVATEDFLSKDSIPQEKLHKLEQHVQGLLSSLNWLSADQNQVIIGLGGTIRNLAKIHRKRVNYPLDITHNYTMSVGDFYSIYDSLKTMGLDDRKKVRGMSPKRADIIVGGLAILKSISSTAASKQLVISGSGLREGVFFEYLERLKPTRLFSDVLGYSLDNYIDLYNIRRDHAEHVTTLALSMFDQLKSLHGLDYEERKLLRTASLLHDIGISVGYYGHHHHSFYIIVNSMLNGLSHREIVLIAAIAGSHGKDKFKDDWEKTYKSILEPSDIKAFRKLALIMKLAECLDRSETGIIKSVECQVDEGTIKIKTFRTDDAELELNLANENNEAFRKVFNRGLHVT